MIRHNHEVVQVEGAFRNKGAQNFDKKSGISL